MRHLLLSTVIALFGCSAQLRARAHDMQAPAGAAPPRKLPSVEGITEYALPNGLRVLFFPDPSQARVTVNATYLVGSRHEGYGEAGMAHLLEHMLFKGSQAHPNPWAELEKHGAAFNGSTWTDRTNYFETMPAKEDNLEWALGFEADRMRHSSIAQEALAKEFSVVRNEFEMGENDPKGILTQRMEAVAYEWHSYGRSTIGNRSDIERVPADRLHRFYDRFYQPDNAVLVVAGNFDEKRALDLVARDFGAIPRPERKLDATYTVEPVQDGERAVTLRRVGEVSLVGLAYHVVPGSHADFVAVEALGDLMTRKPSGRLYKGLVEKGLAASVDVADYAFCEPGLVEILAEVRKGQAVDKVQAEMLRIVEGMQKAPVTDAEVERFRAGERKDFDLMLNDSQRVAVELSEWAAQGDWRLLFLHRDRVEALKTADVQRVALSYLKPANRTLGLFLPTAAPDRSPLPAQPDVPAVVAGYQGKAPVAEGEVFEAAIPNIEKRTTRGAIGGLKTAFLPKRTRGAAVRAQITLRFGSEKELTGKDQAVELLGPLMMRGTKKHDYQALRDELDRLKAQASINSGTGEITASIVTVREKLLDTIALVAEMLREPTFPPAELEVLRKEKLAKLEAALVDPEERAQNFLERKLHPWPKTDIRYVPTLEEQIALWKKVTAEDVRAIHRTLVGASAGEIAVVGDFDPSEVTAIVEKTLAGWKSPRPWRRVIDKYADAAPAKEVIDTPDKEMAMVMVGHNLEARDDEPDYAALQMGNYVLGGAVDSRLFTRLRQKEGWSYGAFSFVHVGDLDRAGEFAAGAICAPQNAARAQAAIHEEIGRLLDQGLTGEQLAGYKKSWKQAFDNHVASDRWVLGKLARGLYLSRTLDFEQKVQDAVAALSPADVVGALKNRLRPDRLVEVDAGDQKKARQ
jgi:zinc protease